jgi:hypothetical protein
MAISTADSTGFLGCGFLTTISSAPGLQHIAAARIGNAGDLPGRAGGSRAGEDGAEIQDCLLDLIASDRILRA